MDWSTTVGVTGSIGILSIAVILLVRWGIQQNDETKLANAAQLAQAKVAQDAMTQRDAEHVARAKAEGDLAVALIDNAKLHDTLSQLLNENLAATKAKVDAATGSDLIAAARAVMGVPNAGVPATGGAAGADAGGGAAPAAAVHVPSTTSGS